jgi:hypothetical protein
MAGILACAAASGDPPSQVGQLGARTIRSGSIHHFGNFSCFFFFYFFFAFIACIMALDFVLALYSHMKRLDIPP